MDGLGIHNGFNQCRMAAGNKNFDRPQPCLQTILHEYVVEFFQELNCHQLLTAVVTSFHYDASHVPPWLVTKAELLLSLAFC